MPLTSRTRLAQAKRLLRRMEGDEPLMRVRISEYSPAQQQMALKLYADTIEKQRAHITELEAQVNDN